MKPTLHSLRRNQEVWALVEEILVHDEVVINFSGDLIRVQNQTGRPLRTGQRVLLQVQSLEPLGFKLLSRSLKVRSPQHLDVTI
jgi:hypothetical protein